MLRRFAPFALAALAVVALPACDQLDSSGDGDTRPDSERIVGSWDATTANLIVDVGPTNVSVPVGNLAAADDQQRWVFDEDGTFTFVFDPDDDRTITISYQGTTYVDVPLPDGPVQLSGTYTLDTAADEVTFSTVAGQTADDFSLAYSFSGSTSARLDLEAEDPETLARLFGLAGDDYAAFAEYVVGGSITYGRLQ
jgi:hypothetical protein